MKVLKDWAQADRDAFERLRDRRGCTCFISAPCVCCMHPGHPLNQEEDDFWKEVFDLDEACEKAMERIKRQIDTSVRMHLGRSESLGWWAGVDMHARHRSLVKLEAVAHMAWREYLTRQGWMCLKSYGVVF